MKMTAATTAAVYILIREYIYATAMRLGTGSLSSSPELAFLPEVIWEALGRDVDDDDERTRSSL